MLRICFVIVVVLSCNVLLGESKLKNELEIINKDLVEAVSSTDRAENFKFLNQSLDEKSKKIFWKNSKYVKALRKLVALKADQCDFESYENIKEITDALGDARTKITEPVRRISKLVRDIVLEHANHCYKVYFDLFESKASKLDKKQVDFVDTFYASIENFFSHTKYIGTHQYVITNWLSGYFDRSLRYLFEQILEKNSIVWEEHGRYVYIAMKMNAKDDPDSKYLKKLPNELSGTKDLNEQKFKELYDNYIISPCRYYNSELKDVFVPAAYDAFMYHVFDESKPEFYRAWARSTLCSQLLSNESLALKYAMQAANRQGFDDDE